MEFKKIELVNGLVVVGELNKFAMSVAVGFFVKAGSRDENKKINGISHLLEHMIFKGTERLSPYELLNAFEQIGANYNAFTTEDFTFYYSTVLPEHAIEVTQLWAELMSPAFRSDDLNLEKNVIKDEIALYKDIPSFDAMNRCKNLHFDGHPCGNSVMGSVESIQSLTSEQMLDYFMERYTPNNIIFSCAGNFEWDEICSTMEASSFNWQKRPAARKLEHCPGSKKIQRIDRTDLSREHICIISAAPSAQESDRLSALMLSYIIGDYLVLQRYKRLQ